MFCSLSLLGEALERRLLMRIGGQSGGWRMFAALWHISSIEPAFGPGDLLPAGLVIHPLDLCTENIVDLAVMSASLVGRPLVLNFGSCT